MSILGWIVVGFIAGILARWVTGARSLGCLVTTVVGILGGLIGGALFRLATDNDTDVIDDFDIGSIFVAFIGAVLLLLLLEAISRDRRW
ncbi:MAG: GlsB/YeaQ/YmgE family stress response membrane protein [Acidimicrobiales bacterium]